MTKISLTEWAKREGISDSRAREKARNGLLKTAEKIGRNWLINEEEINLDNRFKDENVYYVIESFKGNETVVFSGTKKECYSFEDKARSDLIRENGDDITAINDFYTISKNEREKQINRKKSLEEYAKTLTKEDLSKIVEIDGKKYAKWIIDFKENNEK